jgi:hypothetical protein
MATSKFPGPNYNQIIDTNRDKQIVQVPIDNVDFGSRPVTTNQNVKNSMSLEHVKSKG